MRYVARTLCCLLAGVTGVLWHTGSFVGCLHRDDWGPWRGHESFGGDPTIGLQGFRYGNSVRRQATDRGGGQSTRAPISGLPEECPFESRWHRGKLGGLGPMEHHQARGGEEGRNNHNFANEEAQVWVHPGSTGRRGIRLRNRGAERRVVLQLREEGWRDARGSRRSKFGTGQCSEQETGDGFGSICGFRYMEPLPQEDQQIQQVPELPTSGRRHLYREMGTWPSQLCSMAGIVPGDEIGVLDAGSYIVEWAVKVGVFHRATAQQVPHLLALDRRRREQGEAGPDGKDEHEGEDGCGQRSNGTAGLDTGKAMGSDLEHGFGQPRVLARTSSRASTHMASKGLERDLENASRGDSVFIFERRYDGSSPREGRDTRRGGEPREELIENQAGSSEEEENCRQNGTGRVEIFERRRKSWRRIKRRQVIRWGRRVLCLEQQQRVVCGSSSRRTLQREEGQTSPMHHMQKPRTSELQVPPKVEVLGLLEFLWKRSKQCGDGGEEGRRPRRPTNNKDLGKEDKSKVRKFRDAEDSHVEGDKVEIEGEMMDEAKYFTVRIFTFLHHFAGKEDNLGRAVEKEARDQGIRVKVFSVEKDRGENLLNREPYVHHLATAQRGDIDGYHSGFPCNTFSRLRFREREGLPKPLRTRSHPYGLPTLDARGKKEVDEGTVMMCRSINMMTSMKEADANMTIPSFYTLENPPESNVEEHISAWEMPEMKKAVDEDPNFKKVYFNTCIYQQDRPQEERMKKPQCFGGNLPNLQSLGGFCKCPLDAQHMAVVGPERSKASGEYPKQLCAAYAKLAVKHFIKMGRAEFLEAKRMGLQKNIDDLKEKAEKRGSEVRNKRPITPPRKAKSSSPPGAPVKKRPRCEEEEKGGTSTAASSGASQWTEGRGKYGMVREGKGNTDIFKNAMYVGGMRNPAKSVKSLPTVENLGKKINACWQGFIKKYPEALNLAESYGTKDVQVDERIVQKWKEELKRLTGCRNKPNLVLKQKDAYETPVDTDLLEAWIRRSGDPEGQVVDWLRNGAPLGIERRIETSGIFPPVEEGEEGQESHDAEGDGALERKGFKNYLSVEDNKKDAEIEISRYREKKFVMEIKKDEGLRRFGGGTLSRLGLVLKTKESGEVKRRIVIDLKRSGGNRKSHLPERLVLPRPYDVVSMARRMVASSEERGRREDKGCEFVLIDVADAFTTLPLHPEEWKHATSPGLKGDTMLVFRALLFGFRTAPLLYSRFASLLARLTQAISDQARASHQTYLDDSLWLMMGSLEERNVNLSLVLHTMLALGVDVSMKKGERASSLTWVGVKFSMAEGDNLILGLPEKFLTEVLTLLQSWDGKGMAPTRELRALAGKTAWLGGILPRCKWCVAVFYGVLRQVEADEAEGKEEQRATRRTGDNRVKKGLFAISRLEVARKWMCAFCTAAMKKPMRTIYVGTNKSMEVKILTDASPEGIGGMLVINGHVVTAMASIVDEHDEKLLQVEIGAKGNWFPLPLFFCFVWGVCFRRFGCPCSRPSVGSMEVTLYEKPGGGDSLTWFTAWMLLSGVMVNLWMAWKLTWACLHWFRRSYQAYKTVRQMWRQWTSTQTWQPWSESRNSNQEEDLATLIRRARREGEDLWGHKRRYGR